MPFLKQQKNWKPVIGTNLLSLSLFESGINWGRVIALLGFGYRMAIHVYQHGITGFLRRIAHYMAEFVLHNRIAQWIAQQGGWVSELKNHLTWVHFEIYKLYEPLVCIKSPSPFGQLESILMGSNNLGLPDTMWKPNILLASFNWRGQRKFIAALGRNLSQRPLEPIKQYFQRCCLMEAVQDWLIDWQMGWWLCYNLYAIQFKNAQSGFQEGHS